MITDDGDAQIIIDIAIKISSLHLGLLIIAKNSSELYNFRVELRHIVYYNGINAKKGAETLDAI